MPKVLISDSMDSIAQNLLEKNKIQVDVKINLEPQQLKNIISDYDGLIVRSATKVTKDILESTTNLKIIGRAGAGVDNIDLDTAKEKNIIVMNTPGGNTNATAEHTLALLFSLIRNIPDANKGTHEGLWEKKKLKGNEIKGKTIGIIGFGNVGKRFAEMCFSLGLNILIHSKYFNSIRNEYDKYDSVELDFLIKNSDIISFHCKANSNNSPLITMQHLSQMKKTCLIINTARGNLVDETDLKKALEQNIIKGAALDVFKNEPATKNDLFNLKNVILTPHIAASTNESQVIVAEMIAQQFCDYFLKKEIINSVI
tara:strand:- start:5359 stop:6297 length:939 start_codon:yes stop_codon:yes gene_type:complete